MATVNSNTNPCLLDYIHVITYTDYCSCGTSILVNTDYCIWDYSANKYIVNGTIRIQHRNNPRRADHIGGIHAIVLKNDLHVQTCPLLTPYKNVDSWLVNVNKLCAQAWKTSQKLDKPPHTKFIVFLGCHALMGTRLYKHPPTSMQIHRFNSLVP